MDFEKIEQTIADRRDRILVRAALNGDSRSFAILTALYRKRVRAMGMSFLKSEADAEDFVQEVFIKVYTGLKGFRGGAAFSTWLTRIAYNTAVTSARRRQQYAPLANEESIESRELTPEERQVGEATKAAVRQAIAELPEKYAVCVELYFFYDHSYEEIERITGFKANTIKSHIFRAKKILREKLREFYEK